MLVVCKSPASVNKFVNEAIMRKMQQEENPLDFGDVMKIHLKTRSQGLLFGSDEELREQGEHDFSLLFPQLFIFIIFRTYFHYNVNCCFFGLQFHCEVYSKHTAVLYNVQVE